jgi:CRP-like cAMP-binding protein
MKSALHHAEMNHLRDFGLHVLARCGALEADEERAVRTHLAEPHFQPGGQELIAEGEHLNRPSLLLEGWALRHRVLSDGRRQICSFILPGDGFGFCPRHDGISLTSTVTLTPVTIVRLPPLSEALHRTPQTGLGRTAWNMLSLEESCLVNETVRLGRQSAYERLIHLLLEFHDRLDAVGLVREGAFMMPFTQEVLSDALGLSTVHTNRTLQQLRREHLIETHMPAVQLLNIPLLAEIADYRRSPRLA